MKEGFEWADDYYAVSVSKGNVDRVKAYIRGQEEYHKKISFAEECEKVIMEFGFTHYIE